jgi:hypothetical protein
MRKGTWGYFVRRRRKSPSGASNGFAISAEERFAQSLDETVVLLSCADSGAKVSMRQTLVICTSAENNPVLDDHVLPEEIRVNF